MKVLTILGARPQFIKAAALSSEFEHHDSINEIIVHTGQHYDKDMSETFFEELGIPKPKYFLKYGGLTHGAMTGKMIIAIEEILIKESPDYVVVYGDTNSTLAGAIAASKLHIPIVHVESGLRSFNQKMPEEVNRVITDRVSDILFCPTNTALRNLEAEGYPNIISEGVIQEVFNVGDIMFDVCLMAKEKIDISKMVSEFGLNEGDYFLVTLHRQENTDNVERFTNIINTLNELSETENLVLLVHPRLKHKLFENRLVLSDRIMSLPPSSYFDTQALLCAAKKLITDSGGMQKEAFFSSVPCVTLRNETEWVETIETGANVLVSSDLSDFMELIKAVVPKESFDAKPYGNGQTAKLIVKILQERFKRLS